MEKFIPASDVKVHWFNDCANMPEVKIIFAEGIDTNEVPHVYREISMDRGQVTLLATTQGIVSYGIHSRLPDDGNKPFWSRGQVNKRVFDNGDVTERTYNGYGASRATFINRFIKNRSQHVFDCGLYGRYNMAGAVSYAYMVEQVKPLAAKHGIHLLVVRENHSGPACETSECEQWRIIPSLAPDAFKLGGDQAWKEERLAKEYVILHEVGDPDFYDASVADVDWKDADLRKYSEI